MGKINFFDPVFSKRRRANFFFNYTIIWVIALILWAFFPDSYLVHGLSMFVLLSFPLFSGLYSLFEPIYLFNIISLFPYALKPLINYYAQINDEESLIFWKAEERYYFSGEDVAFLLFLLQAYLIQAIYIFPSSLDKFCKTFLRPPISSTFILRKNTKVLDINFWKRFIYIFLPLFIFGVFYFWSFVINFDYADYALNRLDRLQGVGFIWLLLSLGIPLSVVSLNLFFLSNSPRYRARMIFLFIFCVVLIQLIAPGRAGILVIIFSAIAIYSQKYAPPKFSTLVLISIVCIVCSFILLFVRELTGSPIDLNLLFYFTFQDLSLFDFSIISVGKFLDGQIPLSWGKEIFQTLLFIIPRSIWFEKPNILGPVEVQDIFGIIPIDVSSVSMGAMPEALYNFGVPGVIIFGLIWSFIMRSISYGLYLRVSNRNFIFYLMIFPTLCLAYVKSGFSMVYYFLVLSPIWWIFLFEWFRSKSALLKRDLR